MNVLGFAGRCPLVMMLMAALLRSASGQVVATERVVVEADRLPDAESSAPFDVDVIDTAELRSAPQFRLDDILRAEVPGFSLFRRNSSRTANPTTQGVTLRNLGRAARDARWCCSMAFRSTIHLPAMCYGVSYRRR